MTEKDLDPDETCTALKPYLQHFRRCVRDAFDNYLQSPTTARLDHDMRAVGSCVHCHIKARARDVFADVAGARVVEHNGLHLVLIENKFACHFKLVDGNGAASFHRSKQQDEFGAHSLVLPGIVEAPVSLRIGYVLDAAVTKVENMKIILPRGNGARWCVTVSMRDADEGWTVTEQRRLSFEVKLIGEESTAPKKRRA